MLIMNIVCPRYFCSFHKHENFLTRLIMELASNNRGEKEVTAHLFVVHKT